ncbi:hypothetical protein QYM36_012684 [Artemia franciscana]|uniref:Atg6 BARA domain-containing protein n=1 Tax=Artemia franciscana TaxID=6661 RepID=A0AA88HVH3_ARTSF|nr:hypothetical protein QYM36_012684 [Artemia franciscana]
MKEMETNEFKCQQCHQIIKLDESMRFLNEHDIAELTLPIQNPVELDIAEHADSFDKCVLQIANSDLQHGFTVVGDFGPREKASLSHHMKGVFLQLTSELFDLMSSTSDVDHPLCQECCDGLLQLLENQPEQEDLSALQEELEKLELEESRLLSELGNLEARSTDLQTQLSKDQIVKKELLEEEKRLWKESAEQERQKMLAEDELRSLDVQLKQEQILLEKLKQTNALNAAFHIWHDGHFGVINGLHLGRLPSVPVEWSEINGAWGQAALLLEALVRRFGLKLTRYRIVPMGSHSYMEDIVEKKELPLYSSGGLKFFWDSKFDGGMVAFLDCLQHFQEHVEKIALNYRFQLPYRIDRGKLEDRPAKQWYSIK